MDKNITIKASLDNSQFDQQIKQMEQKLTQMKKTSDIYSQASKSTGTLGENTKAFFGDFNRDSINRLREMFNQNNQKLMSEAKDLQNKQKELSKLQSIEKVLNQNQADRLKMLKQEVETIKQRNQLLVTEQTMIQKAATQIGAEAKDFGNPPTTKQAPTGADANSMFKKLLYGVSVNAIVQGALDAGRYVIERDRKLMSEQAQGVGIATKVAKQFYAGQGTDMAFWMPEKLKAMAMAQKEQSRASKWDWAKLGGAAVGGATVGAGVGGSTLGAATLGVGALPGAIIGGVMGGIGGLGTAMLSSDKLKARVFDQPMYRAMQSKEGMQKYEQNESSLQALDPNHLLARNYWNENGQNLYGMQRQLGATEKGFFGGKGDKPWLSKQIGVSGTNQETIQDTLSQMLGAGGTTQGANQLTGISARFGQRFFQENAGQVMGRLTSGGIGQGMGGEAFDTKMTDSYKRLMSEAVKIGVDLSTMPRELERFTDITSQMIAQTGNEGVGSLLSAAMPGTSQLAMQSGQSAVQDLSSRLGSGEGFEGQLGYGALNETKDLSRLSVNEKQLLNSLPLDQITADNPLLQSAANKLGKPIDTIVEQALTAAKEKVAISTGAEEALNQWGAATKGMKGKDIGQFIKAGGETGQYITAASEYFSTGRGPSGKNWNKDLAATNLGARVLDGSASEMAYYGQGSEASKILGGDLKGGVGAEEARARGTAQSAGLEASAKYLDEFRKAAQNTTATTVAFSAAFAELSKIVKNGGEAFEAYNKLLKKYSEAIINENLINTNPTSKSGKWGR
jgi:hypothetical protein